MSRVLKRPAPARGSVTLPFDASWLPTDPTSGNASTSAAASGGDAGAMPLVLHADQQAEIERLRNSAYDEALVLARASAEKELKLAVERHAQAIRLMAEKIERTLDDKLTALEPLGIAIAFEAIAKLLGSSYAEGAGVAETVKQLLRQCRDALRLTVFLAPQQCEAVKRALAAEAKADGPNGRSITFQSDAALEGFACRIASEQGQLETSLRLQLQTIQDSLLAAFAARAAEAKASR